MSISRRNLLTSIAAFSVLPACDGTAAPHHGGDGPDTILSVEKVARPDDPCDGTMINRAIKEVQSRGGGIVQLEARTYNTSVPILLESHVTLQGRGATRSRIRQTGSIETWSAFPAPGILSTRKDAVYQDLHVKDLSVEGLHKTPVGSVGPVYAKSGIAFLNARDSSIQRCQVSDVGTGIGFFGRAGKDPHRNLISDCKVRNASSWVEPSNSGTPRGITMATDYSTVRNCAVAASHTGYYVATEHGTYENCEASSWQDDGFYVNANGCRLQDCRAVAAASRSEGKGSGFAVNPSKGNQFIRCTAIHCPNAGMRFRHAGLVAPCDSLVSDCTFIDCGYGVLDDMIGADPYPAATASRNVFIGNTAKSCQLCGFLFIRQADGQFKRNVAISNNRGGITVQNMGGISFAEYCLRNVIEDNVCDDPEDKKTQKWGLYIYPPAITGASIPNSGNKVRHRSRYGTDRL